MFDPYHIFKRKVHSSHAGQVLRKKNLGTGMPQAYTQQDIEEILPFLYSLGYRIYDPSEPSYSDFLIDRSFHFELETGPTETRGPAPNFLYISDIWPLVKTAYSDIFKYDSSRIKAFQFSIAVNSFRLYGTITQTSNSNSNRVLFNVPNPSNPNQFDNLTTWNIGSIQPNNQTIEGLYQINQYSTSNYMTYACFDRTDSRTARDLNFPSKAVGYDYTTSIFTKTYDSLELYNALLTGTFPAAYDYRLIGYSLDNVIGTAVSLTSSNSMVGITLSIGIKI